MALVQALQEKQRALENRYRARPDDVLKYWLSCQQVYIVYQRYPDLVRRLYDRLDTRFDTYTLATYPHDVVGVLEPPALPFQAERVQAYFKTMPNDKDVTLATYQEEKNNEFTSCQFKLVWSGTTQTFPFK